MEATETPRLETHQYRVNLKQNVPVKLLAPYKLYGTAPVETMWTVESVLHENRYYDLHVYDLSAYVLNEMEVLAWASKVNNG